MPSQSMANESPTTGLNAFKPRVLHTAYFVADVERSLKFYRDVLGMREQQRFDLGDGVQEVRQRDDSSKRERASPVRSARP